MIASRATSGHPRRACSFPSARWRSPPPLSSRPPAHADTVRNFTINGKPPSQTPKANITVSVNGNVVGVQNASDDADNVFVTGYRVQLGSVQILDFNAKESGCTVEGNANVLVCRADGVGIPSGFNDGVRMVLSPASYGDGAFAFDVTVKTGGCADDRQAGARVAATKCADDKIPATPKFTNAGMQGRSVGFQYKASGATKYICELVGPGRTKKTSSCGAQKIYNNLAPGKYTFSVKGVNKKGKSKKAAKKAFTIT